MSSEQDSGVPLDPWIRGATIITTRPETVNHFASIWGIEPLVQEATDIIVDIFGRGVEIHKGLFRDPDTKEEKLILSVNPSIDMSTIALLDEIDGVMRYAVDKMLEANLAFRERQMQRNQVPTSRVRISLFAF